MEYLMTYGWAILIIAVVLAVLFQLGVFSGGNFAPKAQPGSCQISSTVAGTSLEGQCDGLQPEFVSTFSGIPYSDFITASPVTLSSTSISVTAWINSQGSTPVHDQGIVGNINICCTVAGFQLGLDQSPERVFFVYNNIDTTPIPITAGSWIFVAGTYNQTTGVGYTYASTPGSCTLTSTTGTSASALFTNNYDLYIGNDAWQPGGYDVFNGSISNVQLYNTGLTSTEVQALCLEGIGGAPIRPQNIVGWWPLNGNANDYSGNNNNGQITTGSGSSNPAVTYSSAWEGSYTAP